MVPTGKTPFVVTSLLTGKAIDMRKRLTDEALNELTEIDVAVAKEFKEVEESTDVVLPEQVAPACVHATEHS